MSSCVQRFLISGPDLRITARFSPETHSSVQRFWISGGKLGNHCRFFHGKDLGAAVIPDFRGQTWQSLQDFPQKHPQHCSDSGFHGVNLGIDARKPSETALFVHRFLISGPNLGIDAAPSLQHRRTARLQHSRGVQARTGCHEGGIILSKKPPEWRLSPPQQRSASDSNLRRSKEEKPPKWRLLAGMSR